MSSAPSTSIPATLADLKTFFEDQIQSAGQIAINEANVGISGLTDLLNKTIGPDLTISGVSLTLSGDTLTVTGLFEFLSTGFHVSLAFTETNSTFNFSFNGAQISGTSLSLTRLVAQVVPSATNAPSMQLSNLQISFDTSNGNYLFGTTVAWQIPLGQSQPSIQATVAISQSGANLTGSLAMGSATFNVTYVLQKGSQVLTGAWADSAHPLGWDSVVSALGLSPSLDLPSGLAMDGFTGAQLSLDFESDVFTLTGLTSNGAAFLLAEKLKGTWGFAFGAAVANNWTFSQISSSLAVLDFLVFQSAYLLIASFTQSQFQFPNFSLMTQPIDVVPGLNFGANINFASGTTVLAKNVYALAGTSTASVEGSIGTTLANTRLTASLGGSMLIPPTKNLKLSNPELIVIASGPEVEIQGTLEVALSNQVVEIIGRLGISPEKADFTVDVEGKSLLAPFGFTGVTLQEIGASVGIGFTPPSLDLALEAVFQVGNTPSDKCAIEFEVDPDAVNPILLWGQFSSLSLPTIFGAMFPRIPLPSALTAIGLQNAYVFYCEQPTVLPDNTAVTPGFAISGTLNAYAFALAAALKIDFSSGVSGSAAMTPIHLMNNFVSVTGNGPLGGPAVSFNTISSPYLDVTLDVQVTDIVGANVTGTVTSSGFSFNLAFVVPGVLSETLSCTFTDYHNFSASTDLHFQLNITVGPFTAPKTNINLGSIHINTMFTGHLDLAVSSTSIKGSVNGTFDGRSLPSLAINANTPSLKNIANMVIDQIKADANTIFADVLSDATKWAGMVASGAITGADDAAQVLTGYFGESASAAESLLKKFNLHGSTTVHIDTSSPHLDTSAQHLDVPVQHTDQAGPHLDVPASHVDTSATHVDHSVFGKHVDIGGHSDVTTTPHGDTKPHIDTQVTPHADTSTPHVDTQPHVDTSEHVDV